MKLSSSYGKRPTLSGGPVPIGTPLSWPKNSTIPAGFLNCSVADGTTYDVTYYADLYGKIGTNVLPYYPPTSTNITIIKAKEETVGIVTNADSLGNKPANYYDRTAFKNKIINGNFQVWQRGTSFTVAPNSSIYTADRWLVQNNSNQPAIIEYKADVMYNGRILTRMKISQPTVPTTGSVVIIQRIEDVNTLAGKYATASFLCASNDTQTINYALTQRFGSGGSADVYTSINIPYIANDVQRLYATLNVPSVDAKTIKSNSYLEFAITFTIRSTNAITFTQVQLEEGSIATPFEQRPVGVELALCQRYYEKSFDVDVTPASNVNSNNFEYIMYSRGGSYLDSYSSLAVKFKVPKRTSPTISSWNSSTSSTGSIKIDCFSAGSYFGGTVDLNYSNQNCFVLGGSYTGTDKRGDIMFIRFGWTADAEL